MSANTELVERFAAAWSDGDLHRILAFFHDDAVYINMPVDPPNEGIEAIRKAVDGFLGMADAIEFVVHHTAEGPGGVVMNERTDRFKRGERWVEAPVMGVFEIRDGRIAAWRDYFDLGQFTKEFSS